MSATALDLSPVLRLSLDCLSCVCDLLLAEDLSKLYIAGNLALNQRLFTKGVVNVLRILNSIPGQLLLNSTKSFPLLRGEIRRSTGLHLPIAFRFPFIKTFIVGFTLRKSGDGSLSSFGAWNSRKIYLGRCLLALPSSLTHLHLSYDNSVELVQRDVEKSVDPVLEPYVENGLLSIRKLFPNLRALIFRNSSPQTLLPSETSLGRYASIHSSLYQQLCFGRRLISLPNFCPPNLTRLELPLKVPYGHCPEGIPASVTILRLNWERPQTPDPRTPAYYLIPTDSNASSVIGVPEKALADQHIEMIANFRTVLPGLLSLTSFHMPRVLYSVFDQLTELKLTTLRDTGTADLLPRTLTSFSCGFSPSEQVPAVPVLTPDNYDTFGWISIVEHLPRSITKLEMWDILALQATAVCKRGFAPRPQRTADGEVEVHQSYQNPFPPKLRFLSINFFSNNTSHAAIKELGDCSLSELLPSMETLEELQLTQTVFELLAPYPRLSRLITRECSPKPFTGEQWQFIPSISQLSIPSMLDTALLEISKFSLKNLASLYTKEIYMTGELLRRHTHPIKSLSPQLLLDDLKAMTFPFSFVFGRFVCQPITYLPPDLSHIGQTLYCLSPTILLPYLLPKHDGDAQQFISLPPHLQTLSLAASNIRESQSLTKTILSGTAWRMDAHPSKGTHLPLFLSNLAMIPASITNIVHGLMLVNLDTELELLAARLKDERHLSLPNSIMSAVSKHAGRRLKLTLCCSRDLFDQDLVLFSRETKALVVESKGSQFTCEALSHHFSSLTSLSLGASFTGKLCSLNHLNSLTKIRYEASGDLPKFGLELLPPSITELALSARNHVPIHAMLNAVAEDERVELPWPPALRHLEIDCSVPSVVKVLPTSGALEVLRLTDASMSITFQNHLVTWLPKTLTMITIPTYNLTEGCFPHLPPNLRKFKTLGSSFDQRAALDFLKHRNRLTAQ